MRQLVVVPTIYVYLSILMMKRVVPEERPNVNHHSILCKSENFPLENQPLTLHIELMKKTYTAVMHVV